MRVLVVDDSAYNRVTLTRMLTANAAIEVAGAAVNGEDAIKQVMKLAPDVITLDLEMPGMDGFTFLRWLMQNRPLPVIIVSSRASDRSVFKALELGAIDFVVKPGGAVSPRLPEIERELVAKVHAAAGARLENLKRERGRPRPQSAVPSVRSGPFDLIAIGCSTGGPSTLQHLLEALPVLPVSIVVAQHMPATFTTLFAERIDKSIGYEAREGQDGDILAPGRVYIAPGGKQTEIERDDGGLRLKVVTAAASDHVAPSVDRLMTTASTSAGERMIGVILTGMGDDGSRGIRAVRDRGGRTIAESADTAIIFGMPNQAIKTGAVEFVLPLDEIARAIERLCTGAVS